MFSSSQLLELFVVLCTADHYRYALTKIGDAAALAQSKSGAVRPDSMPTRLSTFITPLQGLVHFIVPTVYIFSVIGLGFRQPQWMEAIALPEAVYGVQLEGLWKNALRVLACVASIALQGLSDAAFEHLDDQFHPIGVRVYFSLVCPRLMRSLASREIEDHPDRPVCLGPSSSLLVRLSSSIRSTTVLTDMT